MEVLDRKGVEPIHAYFSASCHTGQGWRGRKKEIEEANEQR